MEVDELVMQTTPVTEDSEIENPLQTGVEIRETDATLQSDEQGTGSARIESKLDALGNAIQAVADLACDNDEILRVLAIADGIASGIQTEGINAPRLGRLMLLLRENAVARDLFILKASQIQGVVDLTGIKGFNNTMAHVLWNPALGPKMQAMHLPSSKKGKQSIGAHRITNWIKAFENDQNDEKAKTTTVTDVLAVQLYKAEAIDALMPSFPVELNFTMEQTAYITAHCGPQAILRGLCTTYPADRVQKWAEKAHEKAKKAGYIPSDVEPEQA